MVILNSKAANNSQIVVSLVMISHVAHRNLILSSIKPCVMLGFLDGNLELVNS